MTQATDVELKDIITGMREEMRVGFANIDTKFANVTTQITRLDGKIDKLEIKLDSKIGNTFDVMTAKLNNIDINAKNTVDLAEKIGDSKIGNRLR